MAAKSRRRRATWQDVHKNDIKLSELLAEFLEYHEALNHSPKTVRWYSDIITALAKFIGPEPCLGELTLPRIRAYQSHLRKRTKPDGESLSDKTLQDHARVLKGPPPRQRRQTLRRSLKLLRSGPFPYSRPHRLRSFR